MAKVSLRIYIREIESLVDQGRLDEAIAHCRHILKTFPKHLETYRLLGKAYLEAKRYAEAVDIFQRVLMAVPDDFVAHVGMSIVRDDEGRLDEAIWYMERAFEAQPSNAAIQGELQRLYGRRDGVEPPRIRMTRGALAHMYVQGELHPQAIAEIRAVLAEDPNRADMHVLLARAYFRNGQKSEAAEVCAQLLKKYPYCLDANRVLVEILPGTERAESTQVYRHRVNEMDPYAAFASGSVFQSSEVADAAVSLERLEWKGQAVDMQPEWGTSLGIGLTSGAAAEKPEWMKPETGEAGEGAAAETGAEIPVWMRAAGWSAASGAAEEGQPPFVPEEGEGELAQADLPDWIKAMAPPEGAPAGEPQPGPAPTGAQPEEPVLPPASRPPPGLGELGTSAQEQDDALAWLESLAAKHGAKSEELLTRPEERLESPPEWVQQVGAGQEQPSAQPGADETGVWLSGLSEGGGAEAPAAAAAEEAVPDWLKGLEPGEPVSAAETPASEQELPGWLSDLDTGVAARPEGVSGGKVDLNNAPMEEIASLPGIGEQLAMGIVAHRQAFGEFTSLEDLLKIAGIGPAMIAELRGLVTISGVEPAFAAGEAEPELPEWLREEAGALEQAQPTGPAEWQPLAEGGGEIPPAAPAATEEPLPRPRRTGALGALQDPLFKKAQDELQRGEVPAALEGYAALIRKGRWLDEIIYDLREVLYRYPIDISIWQTLGDAYMRAHRLQEALDAYTKAEELLR